MSTGTRYPAQDQPPIRIDLNADLGECGPSDSGLLELVSSANISCGTHAGNLASIRQVLSDAALNNVRIGAHPSYPDRENMGRRTMKIANERLRDSILQQLTTLRDLANEQGLVLGHVKAHGALYNDAARDPHLAMHFCQWIKEFDPTLIIVGLAGGEQLKSAQQSGLRWRAEAFVDRTYAPDGSLVPRSHPKAMIHDQETALAQCLSIIREGHTISLDGQPVRVSASTFCIHGDSPSALSFARSLHHCLTVQGISIAAD